MKRLIPTDELYEMNTIGVKLETQNREYVPTIGNTMIVKPIRRTKYLKVCWMCGTVYESYKYNTYPALFTAIIFSTKNLFKNQKLQNPIILSNLLLIFRKNIGVY